MRSRILLVLISSKALNFLVALSAGESLSLEIIPNIQKHLLTSKADVLSANAIEQCIVRPVSRKVDQR